MWEIKKASRELVIFSCGGFQTESWKCQLTYLGPFDEEWEAQDKLKHLELVDSI